MPAKITIRLEYGIGKLLAEICIKNYSLEHPLKYNIIRPFNIVGIGQSSKAGFVIPRFVNAAIKNRPIQEFGEGSQRRTFTHVMDIVDAIILLMNSDINGEIFNIGNPANEISIIELAKKIKNNTNSKSEIKCMDPKTIYGKYYEEAWNKIPNIEKITSTINWKPKYLLKEILEEIINDEKKLISINKKRPNQE